MNPITQTKNLNKIIEKELQAGVTGSRSSFHNQYKDSCWLFIGGLPYDLSEGDVLCVFSQYGEIVNINLVRDKQSGKSKGFAFLCYEDQRSTILAVDNLNGIKILGRIIRVDHCADYRRPKETGEEDDVTRKLWEEGCAPKPLPSAAKSSSDRDVKKPINKPNRADSSDGSGASSSVHPEVQSLELELQALRKKRQLLEAKAQEKAEAGSTKKSSHRSSKHERRNRHQGKRSRSRSRSR